MAVDLTSINRSAFRTSDKTGDLSRALATAQMEMEPAKRTRINPDFPESGYSDLAEVMRIAKALNKQGISIMQPFTARYEPDCTVVSIHTRIQKDEQWMENTTDVLSDKWTRYEVAGAATYGRRQALQAMIGGVSEGEDNDGNTTSTLARTAPAEDKTDVPDEHMTPQHDDGVAALVEGALSEIRAATKKERVDELWTNAAMTHKAFGINSAQFEVLEDACRAKTAELKRAA